MKQILLPAARLLLVLTVITGVLYPLLTTGLAQLLMPAQANGSLLTQGDRTLGSELIGQQFSAAHYFWSRPSATGYNAAASGGSNLGPSSPALHAQVGERVQVLRSASNDATKPVPVELVTNSASGIDPHLSVAAVNYQAVRVAGARKLALSDVQRLIDAHIEPRRLSVLGEPVINVLKLNLALDALAPVPAQQD